MQDEEVNRAMNAVTPKSSPLPTPKHKKEVIEVIIPPNICDPLNLTCNDNEEYEKQLLSPLKKISKRRNRKRKRAACPSLEKEDVIHETTEVKKCKETIENPDKAIGSSTKGSPSEKTQSTNSEMEQNRTSSEDKKESPQKDKNRNLGRIGNKFERDDKNRLRLKGLEELKDKRLRKVIDFKQIIF